MARGDVCIHWGCSVTEDIGRATCDIGVDPHKCPYSDKMEIFKRPEQVNNPRHYGGADNPYEAIKVIEAWFLNFNLGNCVKYVSRAGKKGDALTDLKKARWYLDREINALERDSS